MRQFFKNNSTINESLRWSLAFDKGVNVIVKREDLLHPEISGNKFRKLKYNLLKAKANNFDTLLTYGGAYSNHIAATAAAGYLFNFKTIGVIRGDELGTDLEKTLKHNPTLDLAHKYGMRFKFVSRAAYRLKDTPYFFNQLCDEFGHFYNVPEGGTNSLAIKGCEEILTSNDAMYNYICVAVGTGGTISGLINTAQSHQKVLGFSALKGDFLNNTIEKLTKPNKYWQLVTDYHLGGYAKVSKELITFINNFKTETGLSLDAIYTGKMFYGLADLITKNYFKSGTEILVIHSGGLQGNKGINSIIKRKYNLELI